MNFLAHVYLSGNSEGLIIGNFIADSVKGSDYKNFSPEIQQGILLHRRIDSFTDTHPVVEQSKQRLRQNYRKYASVIVDVYYDHFLAANWKHYSEQPLADYTQHIYAIIRNNITILPLKSSQFAGYMLHNDILFHYSNLNGIEKVLQGMSQRAKFVSNMEHSIHDLVQHFDLFEKEFTAFFPELKKHVEEQLKLIQQEYANPFV